MLRPAGLYENELKLLFTEIAFDEEYMFANTDSYREEFKIASEGTWNRHQFASVNSDGDIVGYMEYRINRDSLATSSLQAINFKKDGLNATFGKDLRQLFMDLFMKFKFRKLNFSVVVGNPAEAFYDKYIEQMGGRIVGIYEEDVKLFDGNYYDLKIYEVLRDGFMDACEV